MDEEQKRRLEKRVAYLEHTLGTLITWLTGTLGSDAVNVLLRRIDEGKEP